MSTKPSLAQALTEEHHDIDAGIEEFMVGVARGEPPADLAASMRKVITALRRHIYLEEEFAFPPIRSGGLIMPIMVMEREHGVLWRAMDDLEERLAGPSDPEGLLRACQELLDLLADHNEKEEPIVYPHLDVDLPPADAERLAELIAVGTTPPGWACVRAVE